MAGMKDCCVGHIATAHPLHLPRVDVDASLPRLRASGFLRRQVPVCQHHETLAGREERPGLQQRRAPPPANEGRRSGGAASHQVQRHFPSGLRPRKIQQLRDHSLSVHRRNPCEKTLIPANTMTQNPSGRTHTSPCSSISMVAWLTPISAARNFTLHLISRIASLGVSASITT